MTPLSTALLMVTRQPNGRDDGVAIGLRWHPSPQDLGGVSLNTTRLKPYALLNAAWASSAP